VPCPLEPTHFFKSLRSKGIKILEEIEAHVSTSNNNCNHPQLKDLVFDGPLEFGTTPLLLACNYGDVDWVKRIVEDWGVDVNVAAVYFMYNRHGPKISKATPLFAAAFNGHISIIEYLVGKGASVSSKTSCEDFDRYYDDWTPLYGFFYQLYGLRTSKKDVTNIVRLLLESGADPNDVPSNRPPIWMSQTCGVGATTTLIHRGLDLTQLNSDGETVLHHRVKAHSSFFHSFCPDLRRDLFGVVQLLVDKGADLMAQDNKGNTVILAAVKSQDWNTIDYILDNEGVNRMEKIEAAEVAAATILSKSNKHSECERAFGYWRRALHLRQTDPDPMQKTILVLESGQAGEWITSDQLEHVIKHPSEYKFQSFLVRLRICSNRSWGAVLDLIDNSFNDCLVDLNSQGRLVDLLDVLWATFETFHRNIHLFDFEPDYDLRSMIDNVVENLIKTLSKLAIDLLNVKTLKLALEVMVAANDFVFNLDDSDIGNWSYCYSDHQDNPHMNLLLRFFAFLAGLPYEILTPVIRQPLRQLVLKNKFGENRQTLLHMACEAEDLPTIRLLLLSGANPNAADKDGNVPLHLLADQSQYGDDDVIQSAAHLLLEYGAQLERTNEAGETPADIWTRLHDQEAGWYDPPEWCLKPVTVPTLKRLCARVVRAQNIPTNELPYSFR